MGTKPANSAARLASEVIAMRAHVGDRLVLEYGRIGLVIGVPAEDGSPPYIVKWLKDGHIAMVHPDQYARIVPAAEAANADRQPGGKADRKPGEAV